VRILIPYEWAGHAWNEIELERPRGGLIADTKKVADGGDYYSAMLTFIAGSCSSMSSEDGHVETDRASLKNTIREMPYQDVEWAVLRILIMAGNEDAVEGMYECPRCSGQLVCEGEHADRITDLQVVEATSGDQISHEMKYPVEIRDRDKNLITSAKVVEMRWPTLRDCIVAYGRQGIADTARFQFAIYAQAITKVDGEPVDDRWRTRWGMMLFERMDILDINSLTKIIRSKGQQTTLIKNCPKCGKSWEAEVDTGRFFASGLRG